MPVPIVISIVAYFQPVSVGRTPNPFARIRFRTQDALRCHAYHRFRTGAIPQLDARRGAMRRRANDFTSRNRPTDWFEPFNQVAQADPERNSWVHRVPTR
jgi:hypothetical protein